MGAFGVFFRRYRALAYMLVLAAICLKAFLPHGYMIAPHSKTFTVQICNGMGDHKSQQIVIPIDQKRSSSSDKAGEGHCAFVALSMDAMASVSPALLALALAFVMAAVFRPCRTPKPKFWNLLRPPVRGPPAII